MLLFLLLLHHLVEFYQFRGMPPGPRFYNIPPFGNFLSFDSGAGKSLLESTQRWVSRFCNFCYRCSVGMPDMECAHLRSSRSYCVRKFSILYQNALQISRPECTASQHEERGSLVLAIGCEVLVNGELFACSPGLFVVFIFA